MNSHRLLLSLSLGALIYLFPSPFASAAVLVDIGDGNGSPAAPDSNGHYWTTMDDFSATALLAMDGTSSGWSLQITPSAGDTGYTGGSLNVISEGAPDDFSVLGAYNDGFFDNTNNGLSTFSFTGLEASTTYALTLWGSRRTTSGGAAGRDADIVVTTGSATGGPNFTLVMATPLTLDVTSDSSGNFAFTFDKASGSGITGLNALSLVPEPGTGSLLLGSLGLLLLRRKRG